MSAEKNIKDNTSKEVLSDKSAKITGDIYKIKNLNGE